MGDSNSNFLVGTTYGTNYLVTAGAGNVTSIHAYFDNPNSYNVKVAIYDENGNAEDGTPDDLLWGS